MYNHGDQTSTSSTSALQPSKRLVHVLLLGHPARYLPFIVSIVIVAWAFSKLSADRSRQGSRILRQSTVRCAHAEWAQIEAVTHTHTFVFASDVLNVCTLERRCNLCATCPKIKCKTCIRNIWTQLDISTFDVESRNDCPNVTNLLTAEQRIQRCVKQHTRPFRVQES